ncbi:MAG: hypothetical protein HOV87_09600, partial [Catenulispora sp.]|nr:hypothetical protein [Catenulispora sp.]
PGSAPGAGGGTGGATVPTDSRSPVWAWISQSAADKVHVSVGDGFVLKSDVWSRPVAVTIAGIFAPVDPADPWWVQPDTQAPTTLATARVDLVFDPVEKEEKKFWHADLLLNNDGAQLAGLATGMGVSWSFPLKPDAITTANAGRVVDDLNRVKTGAGLPALPKIDDRFTGESFDILRSPGITSQLGQVLAGYLGYAGTSMVVMSLGLATLAAIAVGVLALAVRLLIHRQRADLVVARARGASLRELACSVGFQVAAATAPAVAVALAAARAAGYARIDAGSVLLALGVVAGSFGLAGVQTAAALRGSTGALGFLTRRLGSRTDAAVRAGLELLVLALLGAQIMTLRSHGIGSATTGIDPVVATLPVTVALAAGVVLLRVAPLVPRTLAFLLGAGRGATGFVATSSARRDAVIGGLAAVVILATLSGSVFGATFTRSLSEARSESQWSAVGAGAHVTDPFAGFGSSRISNADLDKLKAQPGVTAVAGGVLDDSATFTTVMGSTDPGMPISFVALDVAAYLDVIKGTPLDTPSLHRALSALAQASAARPVADYSQANTPRLPLPALLTSGAALGSVGQVQGAVQYAGMPVSIVGGTPVLPRGVVTTKEPVLVVDYQVLKASLGVEPTRSEAWVAGSRSALAALSVAGLLSDAGDQVAVQAGLADSGGSRELDRLTERVYAGETVLEGLLCALAVLLTLAAGSTARRKAAAFLATMGFGRGRLRRIAVLEALPVLLVVTAGGVATGLATVPLLAGSVDLTSLAGLASSRLTVRVDVAVVVAAAIAVPGVALLAVFLEAALRRPMTLVGTLRSER